MKQWAILACWAAACVGASAQSAGAPTLLIGQTADLSGPQAPVVKEMTSAAQAYIAKVNAAGGVNGRRIVIESLDDGYEPKRTLENAKQLIDQRNVLALFLSRGSANAEALLPLLTDRRTPLVAPVGGSKAMHEPANRYLFNHKPMFRLEVERAVGQLAIQGMRKLAAVYVDDAFGNDAMEGARSGFKKASLEPVLVTSIARGEPKVDDAVAKVVAASPDATLCVGIAKSCAALINKLRAAGSHTQVVSLSATSSDSYVKALGANARGVIVVQAFPSPFSAALPLARELQQLAAEARFPVSYTTMEGLIAAKLLVEGLKRAGSAPTRESLTNALESLRSFDMGGFELGFGPNDRTGSRYVDLTLIRADGRFVR